MSFWVLCGLLMMNDDERQGANCKKGCCTYIEAKQPLSCHRHSPHRGSSSPFLQIIWDNFGDFHLCKLARLATPLMAHALAPRLRNTNTGRKTIVENRSVERTRTVSLLFTYFWLHTEDISSRGKPGELPILGNSCFKATSSGKGLVWRGEWAVFG